MVKIGEARLEQVVDSKYVSSTCTDRFQSEGWGLVMHADI